MSPELWGVLDFVISHIFLLSLELVSDYSNYGMEFSSEAQDHFFTKEQYKQYPNF